MCGVTRVSGWQNGMSCIRFSSPPAPIEVDHGLLELDVRDERIHDDIGQHRLPKCIAGTRPETRSTRISACYSDKIGWNTQSPDVRNARHPRRVKPGPRSARERDASLNAVDRQPDKGMSDDDA